MSLIEAVTPIPPCPCCHQLLRVFAQPSWKPDAPPILQADCQNPTCKLYTITLSLGEHEKLTPAQIDGYARAMARRDSDCQPDQTSPETRDTRSKPRLTFSERRMLDYLLKPYGYRICSLCEEPCKLDEFNGSEPRCRRCMSIIARVNHAVAKREYVNLRLSS